MSKPDSFTSTDFVTLSKKFSLIVLLPVMQNSNSSNLSGLLYIINLKNSLIGYHFHETVPTLGLDVWMLLLLLSHSCSCGNFYHADNFTFELIYEFMRQILCEKIYLCHGIPAGQTWKKMSIQCLLHPSSVQSQLSCVL